MLRLGTVAGPPLRCVCVHGLIGSIPSLALLRAAIVAAGADETWEEDIDHNVLVLGRHSEMQAPETEQKRRAEKELKEQKEASISPEHAPCQPRVSAQKEPPPTPAQSSAPDTNSWYMFAARQQSVQSAGTEDKRVLGVSQGEDLRADKRVLGGMPAEDRGVLGGAFMWGVFEAEKGALGGVLGEGKRVLGSESAEERGVVGVVVKGVSAEGRGVSGGELVLTEDKLPGAGGIPVTRVADGLEDGVGVRDCSDSGMATQNVHRSTAAFLQSLYKDGEDAESSAWSDAGSNCDGVVHAVVPGGVGSLASSVECFSGGTLCVCGVCVCDVCVYVVVLECICICKILRTYAA